MRARAIPVLLVSLALASIFGGLGAFGSSLAAPTAASATYVYGGVGDYYGLLVLEGLGSLDFNEEEISPNGEWVIAGSLNPTPTNPYFLIQISQDPGLSPSVAGVTDLDSDAAISAAETANGITPFGSTAPQNPEPSIGTCGASNPLAVNSEGTVVGTTYYQPPNGSAAYPLCGAFVYSAQTGSELLSNLMGNANFFAYRGQAIANNGFIVGDGQTQNGNNVAFLAYPSELPTVTDVEADAGPTTGGTTVTIEGSNFNTNPGGTSFLFGGSAAIYGGGKDATDVVCATTTTCTATTPSVSAGTSDVYAGTGVGYSLANAPGDEFTYVEIPEISGVDPGGGPLGGGNTVVINGSGFVNSGLDLEDVAFDPVGDTNGSQALIVDPANVDVVSDTEIDVTAPDATAAANGAADLDTVVELTFDDNDANQFEAGTDFPGDGSYEFGAPVISSIDPGAGPLSGGNPIVISGSNFENPGLTLDDVVFDPAGDTNGSQRVTVDAAQASVVSDGELDLSAPDATTAALGKAGLDTEVTAVYSDGADVEVDSVTAEPGDNAYYFGAPVITSIDPDGGPIGGGNEVVVDGSGFSNPDLHLTSATFDPVDDTTGDAAIQAGTANVKVISDTEVEVLAPDVTDAAAGAPTLDTNFTLTYEDTAGDTIDSVPKAEGDNDYEFGAPVISSIEPGGGPLSGANTFEIIGSGFSNPDLDLQSIAFDESDDDASPTLSTNDFDVVSDTEIDVTAPDATGAVSSGDGSLATEVTAQFTDQDNDEVDSQALAEGDNDYVFGAPVVDAVVPGGGPLGGGNSITITGSGFQTPGLNLKSVEFDPVDDTDGSETFDANDADVQVVSDTEIDVTAPDATDAADGALSLRIDVTAVFTDQNDNDVGSVPASQGDDDYVFGAPVIDSIVPGGGPLGGGNSFTITGSGFETPGLDLQSVQFDPVSDTDGSATFDADDADVQVVSDTEIDVTAPDASDAVGPGQASLTTQVTALFTDPDDVGVESVPASAGDDDYVFGAPVVDSVAPDSGPLGGGNDIAITGSGFENPELAIQSVVFDPVADTDGTQSFSAGTDDIEVMSDSDIEVTVPDGTDAADGDALLDTTVTVVFADQDENEVDSAPAAAGDNDYTFNETAQVSQAGMYGSSADPTIVILGSGFGTEPPTTAPCKTGGEDFLHDDLTFGDLTTLTGAGAVGDCIGLDVSVYTDSEIVFTFGAGYASYPPLASGDQFLVDVYGAMYTGTASFNSQTVQFTSPQPSDATVGGPPYTPQATSSARLPVAITVDGASTSICSMTGGSVSFIAPGTCTLDANQPGDALYPAAVQVQQSFTVSSGLLAQTIAFANGSGGVAATDSVTLPDTSYVASATGSGAGTVTYSLGSTSMGCAVDPNSGAVSFTGAGSCDIDASAAANGHYLATATDATLTITVTQGSQVISFAAIPSQPLTASPLTVTASASSGLAVTFTSATTPVCTIGGTNGATLDLLKTGTCTVDANQIGDASYAAAAPVAQSFTVTAAAPPPTTTVLVPATGADLSGMSATLDASASAAAGINKVQFTLTGGSYSHTVIGTATSTPYGYYLAWNTTGIPGGTYTLESLVTDDLGTTASSAPIAITVDNTAPVTKVLVPSNGADLSGSAVFDADGAASYGVGITKVQFTLSGGSYNKTVIGTAVAGYAGYIALWNTTTVPGGTYTLQSLATDAAGNSSYSPGITVTVDNTAPATAVLVPATGGILKGTSATLDASASASYGVAVSKVQFVLSGGSLNKSVIGTATSTAYGYYLGWNTTGVSDGTYTLQSLATDAAGNTIYSAAITVKIAN